MKLQSALLTAAISLLQVVYSSGAVHYVNINGTNPTPPYTGWSTAATNIQDAVNVASNGDLILVTNGIYQTGGQFVSGIYGGDSTTNRLAITMPVTVQSVNGSAVTLIDGGNVLRCAYLTSGAVLTGFTLTNGNAGFGGGVGVILQHQSLWVANSKTQQTP